MARAAISRAHSLAWSNALVEDSPAVWRGNASHFWFVVISCTRSSRHGPVILRTRLAPRVRSKPSRCAFYISNPWQKTTPSIVAMPSIADKLFLSRPRSTLTLIRSKIRPAHYVPRRMQHSSIFKDPGGPLIFVRGSSYTCKRFYPRYRNGNAEQHRWWTSPSCGSAHSGGGGS